MAHPGWSRQLPVLQRKIAAHEYFHVLQIQAYPGGSGPLWLLEGSAEYVGYAALIAAGVVDLASARELAGMRRGISDLRQAPALPDLETRDQWNAAAAAPMSQVYSLGYAATEALLGSRFNIGNVLAFYGELNRSTDWHRVFEQSFGRSVEGFYEEVAQLRR